MLWAMVCTVPIPLFVFFAYGYLPLLSMLVPLAISILHGVAGSPGFQWGMALVFAFPFVPGFILEWWVAYRLVDVLWRMPDPRRRAVALAGIVLTLLIASCFPIYKITGHAGSERLSLPHLLRYYVTGAG